jgi:hypothetical protein
MLIANMLRVVTLSVIFLIVDMLSVIMLSAIVLNVVAPERELKSQKKKK